jgi:hypothetical protein
VPYVRTVKTKSGATAVQVVWSSRRGSREIEHIRSAHDEAGLEALKAAARQQVAAGQLELGLGLDGPHHHHLGRENEVTTYRDELLAMQVEDKRAGYNPRCHLNLDANGQPASRGTALTRGTAVTRTRKRGTDAWAVSFRPSPGGSGLRYYRGAHDAVTAILARQHGPRGQRLTDL